MRSDSAAERLLSLVVPRERAAAITGDLIEADRGRLWFWLAVVRTTAGFLIAGFDQALLMAISAIGAWLIVVPLALFAAPLLGVLLTPLVGVLHFLTHHSIRELAVRIPLVQIDWPPMPWAGHLSAVLLAALWGPLHAGRFVAQRCRGRELQAAIVAVAVWRPMAPFLVDHLGRLDSPTTPGTWILPLVLFSVMAGAITERRLTA